MLFDPRRAILPVIITFLLMAVTVGMLTYYFLSPILGPWLTAMIAVLGGFWSGRLLTRYMYRVGKEVRYVPED